MTFVYLKDKFVCRMKELINDNKSLSNSWDIDLHKYLYKYMIQYIL